MDCRKVRQLVPFAADGALDERLLVRVEEHLRECSACASLFDSERAGIQAIEDALRSASQQVVVPDNFAAMVAARAAVQVTGIQSWIHLLRHHAATVYYGLIGSRRAAAAVACTMLAAATLTIGITAGRVLDSSPVVLTRVHSGHLVVFTVRPRPDGNVVAGTDAHSYCRITRSAEETVQ